MPHAAHVWAGDGARAAARGEGQQPASRAESPGLPGGLQSIDGSQELRNHFMDFDLQKQVPCC